MVRSSVYIKSSCSRANDLGGFLGAIQIISSVGTVLCFMKFKFFNFCFL